MRIEFAFGKMGLALDLPDGPRYQVLEARAAAALTDPTAAVAAAVDAPISVPPLFEMARGKRSAAISVCDITRPAPNRIVLPPVLERLEAAGIPRENIRILIATGLHRPATPDEIQTIVGSEIAANYAVLNHHARERSEQKYLGETPAGTPVWIDKRFLSCDLHITLGFIEPHLMLGFSGGRKLIAPGLAGQETIKVIHSPKFMRDRRATEGSIDDNPLHAELLEIARMARHDFLIDVGLGRAEAGQPRPITRVFAGDPELAHRRGVEYISQVMLETLEEPVDAVITTSAGYPLDLTFYQAVKGVTAASHIVKPGGVILLLSECSEGPGAHEFAEMVASGQSPAEFLRTIENAPVTVDQWQLEKLAMVAANCNLMFFTPGMSAEYQAKLWGPAFATPAGAVTALLSRLGPNPRIALIPEGPYVLARAAELAAAV